MSVADKLYSEFNESMIANSIRSESCDDSWMPSVPFDFPGQFLDSQYQSWLMALAASVLVGLSGIVPLLVIPVDSTASLKNGTGAKTLRVLLSFAVGGLLGDVFLHLLPEAWESRSSQSAALSTGNPSIFCGMWVLAGLLAFIIIEKVFTFEKDEDEEEESEKNFVEATKLTVPLPIKRKRSSLMLKDGSVNFEDYLVNNNNGEEPKLLAAAKKATNSRDISGYLNLMANMIDNFTHGLAVGGSFMLSTRVGVFTTFAILVHEIPHEVGDFAILLRAGFSRWDAAWAQLYTASAGVLGAFTALMFNSSANDIEARTSWILPFTAGGFLHIALVTVLPELLDEKNPKESLKQMCSLASGITVMAILTSLVEG